MKPRGTLLTVVGVVVLLAGAAVWYFGSRGSSPQAPGAGPSTERRIAVAPKVPGAMLVNDARDAEAGPATALFAECVLSNPTASELAITTAALGLEVRGPGGVVVPVTWERVGETPSVIASGSSVGVRWVASSRLGPGQYEVVATGEVNAAAAGVARVRVDPARLTVSAVIDADADEAAAIRLLAWRGQSADALARIDAALAATPDALVMQLWRGDLLNELGRSDEAAAQFEQLAAAIDARQRDRPNTQPELPFWLNARIERR